MKTCTKCEKSKPLTEFHKSAGRKDGRQPYCRDCAKSYYKKWQDKSPETKKRHADWKAIRVSESRAKLIEYFQSHPCVDCGNSDIRVLEFDHVTGEKTAGVASLVNRGAVWNSVLEEISKCEVRCANCHRIVTAERGDFWTMAI